MPTIAPFIRAALRQRVLSAIGIATSTATSTATSIALGCALVIAPRAMHAQGADCNAPARDSIVHLSVPGQPFQALPTADGCWIFASLVRTDATPSAIAVISRKGGALSLVRTVPVPGGPTGMALTHDGQLLVVAAGEEVLFLDVARLKSGEPNPLLGTLAGDVTRAGRVYANVSADDAFAFISDERAMSITVINLADARKRAFAKIPVIGRIPVGSSPIALTFSADGRWIYTTSQVAPPALKWPHRCKPQAANAPATAPDHAEGAIIVVDLAMATKKPEKSVAGYVAAGCSPVRLILSPAGDVAYVTARGDNAVLAFDTKRLLTDSAHARIGRVEVGTAPVGMALVSEGRTLIVTNSNRFAGNADDKQFLSILDTKQFVSGGNAQQGTIPAGAFPREMRVTADGKTLIVTNFASRTIEVVEWRK